MCELKRQGFISNRSFLISRGGLQRGQWGLWFGFPGVRGGCRRLGSTAVTRGLHHRGLPAAPGSQFHSFSHFLFPQVTAKEQLCSVRKKHFHSLYSVLLHLSRCGRGCVPPWNQARGPPAAPGARSQRPGILGLPLLCPRTGDCSEVDA